MGNLKLTRQAKILFKENLCQFQMPIWSMRAERMKPCVAHPPFLTLSSLPILDLPQRSKLKTMNVGPTTAA